MMQRAEVVTRQAGQLAGEDALLDTVCRPEFLLQLFLFDDLRLGGLQFRIGLGSARGSSSRRSAMVALSDSRKRRLSTRIIS